MASFFSFSAKQRIKKDHFLLKLDKLIDWRKIGQKLNKLYKKDLLDKGGERPYDPVKMFKAILLGQWYSLSDPGLEEALRVRLDFMLFTGFELLEEDVPDETTLCRFRNRLIEQGLEERLLKEINMQLENLGLKVNKAKGAIIDATIIESSARPQKQIEIQEDRKEKASSHKIVESKDPDARWLKKGKRSFFGYKCFVSVDDKNGYIDKVHITSANVAEVTQMSKIIEKTTNKRIYADKGYCSQENRNILKKQKCKDGIMHKKIKGQTLTAWQKLKNKLISKRRFRVEQCFGTIKRRFYFNRASYMGLAKVQGQFCLKAMCYNLLKSAKMAEIS